MPWWLGLFSWRAMWYICVLTTTLSAFPAMYFAVTWRNTFLGHFSMGLCGLGKGLWQASALSLVLSVDDSVSSALYSFGTGAAAFPFCLLLMFSHLNWQALPTGQTFYVVQAILTMLMLFWFDLFWRHDPITKPHIEVDVAVSWEPGRGNSGRNFSVGKKSLFVTVVTGVLLLVFTQGVRQSCQSRHQSSHTVNQSY